MTPTRKIEQMLAARNVNGLGRALGDRNVVISRRAAQALGELRDPAGVPALAKALLKAHDDFLTQYIVEALRLIGTDAAVDALIGALFTTDRQRSTLAQRALLSIGTPAATTAVAVRDALTRNDWQTLNGLGEEALRPLSVLLNSDLYGSWPSGKRSEVLNYAVRLGATPPARYRRELAAAGIFVSGVHSVAELLIGLGNRNPAIRIAAADALGRSKTGWTARPLYRRFRKASGKGGDHAVAVAAARAMARLGDLRAINEYRQQLVSADGRQAAEAARALADMNMRETVEMLFWFVVSPPPPPAYRNVPVVLSALEAAGQSAVEHLKPMMTHEKVNVRRLMVDIVARCGHSQAVELFSQLALDTDEETQRAAIDAMAQLNSAEAVEALFALADQVPRQWVLRALAVITHPNGPLRLRELDAGTTIVQGTLMEDRQPLAKARVQFWQEQLTKEKIEHIWQPISTRAETDADGAFSMSLFPFEADQMVRMRVTLPIKTNGKGGETHHVDLRLTSGRMHRLRVNLDHFFERLMLQTDVIDEAEQ